MRELPLNTVRFDVLCVCSDVVDKGGVEPLITLLNDAKQLVQANAAVCLTNLATEGMLSYSFCRGVESGRGVSGVQY